MLGILPKQFNHVKQSKLYVYKVFLIFSFKTTDKLVYLFTLLNNFKQKPFIQKEKTRI